MLTTYLETDDYKHFRICNSLGHTITEFEGAEAAGRCLPGDEVTPTTDKRGAILLKRSDPVASKRLFLVGTLELNSKSRYGITSRGVLRYKFQPYDESYPPFFVGCSSKDTSTNLLVRIQFEEWPATSTCPIGVLVQTFGPAGYLAAEEEALLYHYAPVRWERKDTVPVAEGEPLAQLSPSALDATHLETFHIDPPGCKDIDDAISFEVLQSDEDQPLYRVHIHIADVASWLKRIPHLGQKAAAIGQTLYKDGVAVRPMFPAAFSEGHMSLLPGQVRQAWTASFDWLRSAGVAGGTITSPVKWSLQRIRVKESFTYETAQLSRWADLLSAVATTLTGKDAVTVTDSHEWVEQFMLFYNRSAAAELKKSGAGVLRRHSAPDQEKLARMRFLGLPVELLAMRAGEYCSPTEENTLHWGLGSAVYCHASSPIRRWADCINQMALAALFEGGCESHVAELADITGVNAAAKRAKKYERDLSFVRALLGSDARQLHEAVVVEEGKVWIPYLKRIIRANCSKLGPGTPLHAKFFADPSKRNWKGRLVVELEAAGAATGALEKLD